MNIRSSIKLISKLNLLIFTTLLSVLASAAESDAEKNGGNIAEFNSGLGVDSLLQVLIALISVVCVIFVLSVILKKFNMLQGASTGLIKIVGGISLGGKDRLLLIQVGEEQILISASPSGVNKIHDLGVAVEVEASSSIKSQKESGFSALLNSINPRPGS